MAVGEMRIEEAVAALRAAHDILSVTLSPSSQEVLERVEQFQALAAARQNNDVQRFVQLLMAIDPNYEPGGAPPKIIF